MSRISQLNGLACSLGDLLLSARLADVLCFEEDDDASINIAAPTIFYKLLAVLSKRWTCLLHTDEDNILVK